MSISSLSGSFIGLAFFLCSGFQQACQEKQPQPLKSTELSEKHQIFKQEDIANFLMGKFEVAAHPDFEIIDSIYADRKGLWLQKKTMFAFKKMHTAAMKDGVHLVIRSATRNYYAQKSIWEAKWNGKRILSDGTNAKKDISDPASRAIKILEYSSMPGTSRHHWGTDIDLNAFENSWFDSGEGKELYSWMLEHAAYFGFCQPYTERNENRPDGYNEEKWHWSYMPLARGYIQKAKDLVSDEMISGFDGAETAVSIGIKQKYILGINKECL